MEKEIWKELLLRKKVKKLEENEAKLLEFLDKGYKENYDALDSWSNGEAHGYGNTEEFIKNNYEEPKQ